MKRIITSAALLAASTAFANATLTLVADMAALTSSATNNNVTVSSDWTYTGGSVYDFTASNAYFSGGNNSSVLSALASESGYVTVAGWIYFADAGTITSENTLFGYGEDSTGVKFNIKQVSNSTNKELDLVTKGVKNHQTGDIGFSAGSWHFVAASWKASGESSETDNRIRLFYDPQVSTSNYWSKSITTINTPSTKTYAIGSQNGDTYSEGFNGLLAGLSVYSSDSLATADEIKAIAGTAPSAIPEPSAFGLLAGLGALAFAVSRRRRSR